MDESQLLGGAILIHIGFLESLDPELLPSCQQRCFARVCKSNPRKQLTKYNGEEGQGATESN